jgi:hypothetical protein
MHSPFINILTLNYVAQKNIVYNLQYILIELTTLFTAKELYCVYSYPLPPPPQEGFFMELIKLQQKIDRLLEPPLRRASRNKSLSS